MRDERWATISRCRSSECATCGLLDGPNESAYGRSFVMSKLWSTEAANPPEDSYKLYKMLWQLEKWLRVMVYVELRSAFVDWEQPIRKHAGREWPPASLTNDKKLRHMTTSHQSAISYLTLGQLWAIVTDPEYWHYFEPFLPPREIIDHRMTEVKQARHRAGHFRAPHKTDVSRVRLFLQDLEEGLKRFCSTYVDGIVLTTSYTDEAMKTLESHWSEAGWRIELLRTDNAWLSAPDGRTPTLRANVRLTRRPSAVPKPGNICGQPGFFYRLSVSAEVSSSLRYNDILERTAPFHDRWSHVLLVDDRQQEMAFVIPSVLGEPMVSETILGIVQVARDAVVPVASRSIDLDEVCEEWPEYVLRDWDPLVSMSSDVAVGILDLL
jgi:hypothetical protein